MDRRPSCLASICVIGILQAVAPIAADASVHTDPPRVTFPAGVSCPAVAVYAARGSGEAFDDSTLGAGAQLLPFYNDLKALYGAKNVGLEADGYPAVAVVDPWLHLPDLWYLVHDYKPSLMGGIADATADIKAYAHKCRHGDHLLVVAGYSQGADVVRRAMAVIPRSSFSAGMSVQVIMFGDPNFSPKEDLNYHPYTGNIDEQGNFNQADIGVGRVAADLHAISQPPSVNFAYSPRSWCNHKDLVCQTGYLSTSAHTSYGSLDAFAATMLIFSPVPNLTPTVDASFFPATSRRVDVSPNYWPPPGGIPSTAVMKTYVDGHLVNSRRIRNVGIGQSQDFTIRLPNHKWHLVSVVALGHLIEEEPIRA